MVDLNAAPTDPHSSFNHVWGLPASLPNTPAGSAQVSPERSRLILWAMHKTTARSSAAQQFSQHRKWFSTCSLFLERLSFAEKKKKQDQKGDNRLLSPVSLKQRHGLNRFRHSRTTKGGTFSRGGDRHLAAIVSGFQWAINHQQTNQQKNDKTQSFKWNTEEPVFHCHI